MKPVILIFGTVLLILFGCYQHSIAQNHFSSSTDTLIIQMQQHSGKGFSKKSRSIHKLRFKDSLEYDVIVPDKIENIQLAREITDFEIWGYKRIMSEGGKDSQYYPYYEPLIENNRIDTANLLSFKDNSICFLQGTLDGEEVFIVDENFNKDFRDDSIRVKKLIDFSSVDDLIKCYYKIYNGKEYIMTFNWINVGRWKFGKDELYYLTNQHYTADFTIDKSKYKLECFIYDGRFWFHEPEFSLIKFDGIHLDTITDGQILSINEYLRLKEGDYKIHRLSNDGSYVTLIKDSNFAKIDGTQIGMLAPSTSFTSIDGQVFKTTDLLNKKLIVANFSKCSRQSYKIYETICEKLLSNYNIIGIESGINTNIAGIIVDVKDSTNQDIYKKYRGFFSSYDCYLINQNNRIIDKFSIFDWEETMLKYDVK